MVIKRKGNLTREKILNCAKQDFYDRGYNDTQLKHIADEAGLSLGNLNYYFKKKDDLVKAVYNQFFSEIYAFIAAQGITDPVTQFALFQFVVYQKVLNDENNKRFYSEIIQNKSNYRVMHELIRKKYHDMLLSLDRQVSDLDFEIIVMTEFGARREIFLNYFDGRFPLSLDQLCYHLIRNTYKHLEIPFDSFDTVITAARRFVAEQDLSPLCFLR